MLGDRLPRRCDAVPHRQTAAQLEQALSVALGQLIEDEPPRRVGEGLVDVSHRASIGKYLLAYQYPARTDCVRVPLYRARAFALPPAPASTVDEPNPEGHA